MLCGKMDFADAIEILDLKIARDSILDNPGRSNVITRALESKKTFLRWSQGDAKEESREYQGKT